MNPPDTIQEQLPPLPTVKGLGEHADVRPTIVIDTREQLPLTFTRPTSVAETLQSGDYSFVGGENLFAVERKSIADLVSCCTGDNRERFERELHRLRGFRFARLLIVGSQEEVEAGSYRSRIAPRAVMATVSAFEARYIPVVWSPTPEQASMLVEKWAWWFAREMVNSVSEVLKASARCAVARN